MPLLYVLLQACFNIRIYTSEESITRIIAEIDNKKSYKLGEELMPYGMIPLYMISFNPFTILMTTMSTSLNGSRQPAMWILRNRSVGPIIPDMTPALYVDVDGIQVATYDGDDGYYTIKHERVVSWRIPQDVIDIAQKCANMMIDMYMQNKCDNMVYILYGKPGCGKSTCIRLLTKALGALLFSDYNPTEPGRIKRALAFNKNKTNVFAYEEFDVSFTHIVKETVVCPANKYIDATNKTSWNRLLDEFKRQTGSIMVMTTNLSCDEVKKLGCESMLRQGRVDAHFVWTDDGVVKKPVLTAQRKKK